MKKVLFLLLFPLITFGQIKPNENGLAIHGYDLICYFDFNPKKGSNQFQARYEGLTYNFVNQKHLELFKKNPKAFIPQYGGWCAYAMGLNGNKVQINPESYKVIEGKLYLFYKTKFVDTKSKWNKDETNLKHKADLFWANE
jgi:YHS domain-containing protein